MHAKAIVAREPAGKPTWAGEDIIVNPPPDDEVLVKITAAGVCHTDILMQPVGMAYPKILGHEGAGIVQATGKNVSSVVAGNKVLLSYYSCSICAQCKSSKPSFCTPFNKENHVGRKRSSMAIKENKEEIWSRFFGQSSFAEYTLVAEASVLKLTGLLESDEELNLFAPLGCGGMGALAKVADAGTDDVVLVLGVGAVGMAALMTAKIRDSKTIIPVDKFPSRLELAEELGATHTIDTTVPELDFQQAVRDISPTGASVVIDTTGVGELIEEGLESLSTCGRMVHIAPPPPPGYKLNVDITSPFMYGKTITGCIEGSCVSSEAIPQMIQWYREGRFPLDKLITFFPAVDFGKALARMHDGSVLKPVLMWN